MADDNAVRLAMRARLLALVVCTTGATNLSATTTGYKRTAGSFLGEGFRAGMELTPANFGANPVDTITYVDALEIRVATPRKAEALGANRSLSVLLPMVRSFENFPVIDGATPTADEEVKRGRPYVEEQYLPGPRKGGGIGPRIRIFAEPMYLVRVWIPEGVGTDAAEGYAKATLALYPATDVIPLANNESIHIKGDPAPFPGQLLPDGSGHAGILCSVPLRCQSLNTI